MDCGGNGDTGVESAPECVVARVRSTGVGVGSAGVGVGSTGVGVHSKNSHVTMT